MANYFRSLCLIFLIGCAAREEVKPTLFNVEPSATYTYFRDAVLSNRGTSGLGMCSPRFDCKGFISSFSNSQTIRTGYLDNTFGDSCPCLAKILSDPRPKVIRAHILNSTCFPERGRHCGAYECFGGMRQGQADSLVRQKNAKLLNCYRARLARQVARMKLNSGGTIDFYVSPLLESSLSRTARQILLDIAAQYFPKDHLVDNTITSDGCISGYICEKHSMSVAPIVDTDGLAITTANKVYQWLQKVGASKIVQAWDMCINGVGPHDVGFIDPRQRKNFCGPREWAFFKAFNSPEAASLQPANPVDRVGCKQVLPSFDGEKKGFLLKLAENSTKTVAIFPKNFQHLFKSVTIQKDGHVVGKAAYRGHKLTTDKSNRLIYDFPQAPWNLPDNSVLHADGTCFPLEKPVFRID